MGIRVAQWASGNVGAASLRTVVDRPDLDLVALYATGPDKVGRDAGVIAGVDPVGIAATDQVDRLLEARPDVVLHMPLPSLVHGDDPDADLRDFERLLGAGVNVVTTVGYVYPDAHGPEVVARLDEACRNGGASFHGTGANPGWFGDLLPLLMSGLSLRLDRILVQEISNFQYYPSPEIMLDMMNFGRSPSEFEARADRHRSWLDGLFVETVTMVAHGLGAEVDEVTSERELALAGHELATAAGTIRAGTVAGQRYRWAAMVDGRPLVEQETVWRMHADAAPDWPEGDWSITIEGHPEMRIALPHRWNRDVLGSTAAHAINAVPYVVEADPGIATFLDLPIVAGRGAWRV